jgi:LysM repeat protein
MGWQVGPDGNGISFGAEIAEPRNIAYTTPAHTTVDTTKYNPKDPAIIADFELRWKFAVEWWANAMKVTGLQIDHLLSHSEMHKLGMATNHGDPEHWFRCFGRTMDMFRADVQVALDKLNKPTVPIYKVVKVTPPDTLNVRAAATANSAILDTLKDGTVVELVGDSQDGKWSQLRRTGAPGWVRNSFLEELPKTYTVVKGDRLGALAKRFGVTLDDLAEANNIQSPQYLIRIGQVLTIPRGE